MNKTVKDIPMTPNQLFILSLRAYQWWESVFVQAKRFFDALEKDSGGTPWDENSPHNLMVAERMFLITALHHVVEAVEKLNAELLRNNDDSLDNVIQAIDAVVPIQNIKDLRNMNEHSIEYLVEKGHKQDSFRTTIQTDHYNLLTTASWTIVLGDEQKVMIGNVPVDKLLVIMKEQTPIVRQKTKEIFENSLKRQ